MAKHKTLTLQDVHTSVSFEAANEAARLALPLVPADINKLVKQLDTNDFYYILSDVGPTFKLMTAQPGLIGTEVLNDISDVNAATPTDQQVLTWDNGSSKWVPTTIASGGGGGSATGGDLFHPLDLEERGEYVQPDNNSFLDSFNFDKGAILTNASRIASAWRMNSGILSGAKYEASKLSTIDKSIATAKIQYTLQALAPKNGLTLPLTGIAQDVIFNGDVTSYFESGKKIMVAKKLEQFGGLNGTTTSHVFMLNGGSAGGTVLNKVARLAVAIAPTYNAGLDETTVQITNPNGDDLAFGVLTGNLNTDLRIIPFDIQIEVSADGGVNFLELEIKDAQGIDIIRLQGESSAQQVGAITANALKIDFDMSDNGQYGVMRVLRNIVTTQAWDFYGTVDLGKTWTLMGQKTANFSIYDSEFTGSFEESHAQQILVADNGKFIAGYTRKNDSGQNSMYNVYGILTGGFTITDSPDSGLGSATPRAGVAHSSVTASDISLILIAGDRSDLSYYAWTGGSGNANSRQAQFLFTGAAPVQQGITESFGTSPYVTTAPYAGLVTGVGASHRHHLIAQMGGPTKITTFNKGSTTLAFNTQISPSSSGIKILDAKSDGGEKIYVFGRYDLTGSQSLFIVDNAATGTPIVSTENVMINIASGIITDGQNGYFGSSQQSSMKTMGRRMIVNPADSNHIVIASQFDSTVDRATLIEIKNTNDIKGIQVSQYSDPLYNDFRNTTQFEQRGQTVTFTSQRIRSVGFRTKQVGYIGAGFSLYLEVYATLGGIPTGTALATSNSLDPSSIGRNATGEWVYFNFDNLAVENLTGLYAIVIRSDMPINNTNKLQFAYSNVDPYIGGTDVFFDGSGPGWTIAPANDLTFEVHGEWVSQIGHEGGHATVSWDGDFNREVETQISLIDANSANIVWREAHDGNNSSPAYTHYGQSYKRVFNFTAGQGTLSNIKVLGHNQSGGSPDFDESNTFMLACGADACADKDVNTGLINPNDTLAYNERSGLGRGFSGGTLIGAITDVLFQEGKAFNFDGTTHQQQYGSSLAGNFHSEWDWAFEMEVRFDTLTGDSILLSRGGGNLNHWELAVQADGAFRFIQNIGAGQVATISTPGDIIAGQYYRLRYVYDASIKKGTLHKSTDGITYTTLVLTVDDSMPANAAINPVGANLTLSGLSYVAAGYVDGQIGYVKINKNRPGVINLAQNTTADGPFAYAGFKDQSGFTAIELKGSKIFAKRPSGVNHVSNINNAFMTPMMISSTANELAVVDSYDQLLEYEGTIPNVGKDQRLRITKGRKSEDDQSSIQGLNVIFNS